jgi:hypothetical protein
MISRGGLRAPRFNQDDQDAAGRARARLQGKMPTAKHQNWAATRGQLSGKMRTRA